jgi:hypothetical protein
VPSSRETIYRDRQMTVIRRLILPAAIVACAIAFAAGCVTEEVDQTIPPYASTSDEGRDPASAPSPAPSADAGSSGGVMSSTGHAIGEVITAPFRAIGDAFSNK